MADSVDAAWRDPADATPQDWGRLVAWVREQGHDARIDATRQFRGGIANLNYLIEFDGAPAVLRRPPVGPLAEAAGDMDREWRVLSRLPAGYQPAPRGLLYCADRAVLGAPFQIIEYRSGIAIDDALPAGADRTAPSRLTATLLGAMVALHEIAPAAVGLDGLGKPDGFLPRQLRGWTRRAHAVWPDGLPTAARQLLARLERETPEPSGVSLLHMDFKFNNMLVDPQSLALTAVLDWDMATRGCPLFDLAVLLSYWLEPGDPEPLHALGQSPSLAPGFGTRADLAQHYFAARGMQPTPLVWHAACARFRLAVAWMQLYRKWQAGELAGTRYRGFDVLAAAVLEWAADLFDTGAP